MQLNTYGFMPLDLYKMKPTAILCHFLLFCALASEMQNYLVFCFVFKYFARLAPYSVWPI